MTGAQDENILSKRLSARLVSAIFSIPYCDFASDCGAWCLSVRLQEDAPKAGMEPVNSFMSLWRFSLFRKSATTPGSFM